MSTLLALSEDIIIGHVLTRLPVKSLTRFKCVCKSWLHILSNPDPHFITTHITHTCRNPDYECLIMSMRKYNRSRRHYTLRNHHYALRNRLWVEILSRSRLSYTSINDAPEHSQIIGSINGLICLTFKCLFLLWNPATGLIKTIVPPQPYHGNKNFNIKLYGFGWDYGEGEFKVVVCYTDQKSLQGVVYTSNPDSWNELDIPDTFSGKSIMGNTATIVQGCPYWTATSGYDKFVLKFESGSGQFKEFFFPSQVTHTYQYRLVNVKDCLAMMVYLQLLGTLVDVFHLDEECGVWSKTYTFGPIHCYMANFSQCFKYGGEVVFNFAKLLYDPKTNGIKVIGDDRWNFVSGYSYTPSLVSLLRMEPLHTQSHWTSTTTDVENSMSEPAQIPLRLVFKLVFSRLLKCFGWD